MTHIATISQRIWDMKYRLRSADDRPLDKTLADTWRRVARALAAPEKDPDLWQARCFWVSWVGPAFCGCSWWRS